MGLTGIPLTGGPSINNGNGPLGPPTDPARPPRLSRRDRSFYCFHFDLSQEGQRLLSSLVRYVHSYGAVSSSNLLID